MERAPQGGQLYTHRQVTILLFIFLPYSKGEPKKYTYSSSCQVQQGQPQRGKQALRRLGQGTVEGEVGTTAKQQAEELLSALPHLSTPSPRPLPPAHGPPDNRVGHSLSPHARQVPQASLPPIGGAS